MAALHARGRHSAAQSRFIMLPSDVTFDKASDNAKRQPRHLSSSITMTVTAKTA